MIRSRTGYTRLNSAPSSTRSTSAGMQTMQTPQLASTDLIHATLHPCNCAPAITLTHTMPPPRLSLALIRARPQARYQCLRRTASLRQASLTTPPQQNDVKPVVPWKTPTSVWAPENLIPPPKDGEILLERRPNRALPPYVEPQILLFLPTRKDSGFKKKTNKLEQKC